jgi:ubiquinone/menaquinone biosynthesis C-methylase UbiE
MSKITYIFERVEACNMCGTKTDLNRVLGQRMNRSQGFNPKLQTGITTSVIKCVDCGLIYSNPLPIPANVQDHYGVPPEDYWQESYFSVDENYFESQIVTAQKLLCNKPRAKALDIGAGLGKCMLALEKAGFEAFGLEPSVEFREKAITKMGIDAEKLKLGMLEEVEYPSEFFDFITFGAVLEHLYNPSESITKTLNWLKPMGVMHIEVPSSDYLIPKLMNFYYKLRGTNYVNNISPMHVPFHLYEFGYDSFAENSKINNYEIVFHQYYVCEIYHIPKIFHSLLTSYMRKANKGMQLEIWLRKIK